MPATRNLLSFEVKNTKGETIQVQRRCFGGGKTVQKQLETKVYNEDTKKFENPPAPDKKAAKKSKEAEVVAA